MTRTTGKRPYHLKNIKPMDPNTLPIKEWPEANQELFLDFRQWMIDTGCSDATVETYKVGARFSLGFLQVLWWRIDPIKDIDQVWAYLQQQYQGQDKLEVYRKGIKKFRQYLCFRLNSPDKPKVINWAHYYQNLPKALTDAIDDYINNLQRRWQQNRVHESTISTLSHLTQSLRWMAVNMPLNSIADINRDAWFAYMDARLANNISPETLNTELRSLFGFLQYAKTATLPVSEDIFVIPRLPIGPKLPKDIPLDQVRILLAEIEREVSSPRPRNRYLGLMDRAWVLLMLHSGLRTMEVRSLRFEHLDLNVRKIRVEQSKGLKDRLVYFSQETASALENYLSIRGPRESLPEYVFIYAHKPLTKSYCSQRLRTYANRCGVRVSPHQLRHTCATLLLNARVPVASVQMILGHQHIETTMVYARVFDGTVAEDYFKAMNQIEGLTSSELIPSQSPTRVLSLLENLQHDLTDPNQKQLVAEIQASVNQLVQSESMYPNGDW